MSSKENATMPSQVTPKIGVFDRIAGWSSMEVSRAPFFIFCVCLVVAWLTQGIVRILTTGDTSTFFDSTYQLEINTTTTIITFLMVALLQNSQTRNDLAIQHKLNAISAALADLLPSAIEDGEQSAKELQEAVGLEDRESTTKNLREEAEKSQD